MKQLTLIVVSTAAIAAIIASGFIPLVSSSNGVTLSYPAVVKTSIAHSGFETEETITNSTSTSVTTGHSVTTIRNSIYNLSSVFLDCGHWVDQVIGLINGSKVQVSFSASGNLDVFIFTKAQYGSYVASNGNTTSPNVVHMIQQANGSMGFTVPSNGNYYLVVKNPGQSGCSGSGGSIGLYTAEGDVVSEQTTEYFVTSTSVTPLNVNVTITTTQYSTSSFTTTFRTITTETCVLGWLQAMFSSCG